MVFFVKIGNNSWQKKTHVVFGNARPKFNARAHLRQRKKHSGLIRIKSHAWEHTLERLNVIRRRVSNKAGNCSKIC